VPGTPTIRSVIHADRAGWEPLWEGAAFAGNPKTLRAQASSHEHCLALYDAYISSDEAIMSRFDALIGAMHAQGKRVCITCFERHPDDCHRSIIAGKWQERGARSVEHLAPDGCNRLVSV
jgi:hypothetical protein